MSADSRPGWCHEYYPKRDACNLCGTSIIQYYLYHPDPEVAKELRNIFRNTSSPNLPEPKDEHVVMGVDANCHILYFGIRDFSTKWPKASSGEKCEACRKEVVQVIVGDEDGADKEYRLCSDCHKRLVRHSLTKAMFKNLIVAGHSAQEFYLHDDFYDERGRALQPS